ncbi:MLP-like protein 31 [Beta vulgaris subsp. vulgaris]|uniref:MLP-like protein 31 n=1 Tax=Beta vulgaris subsp. vulgaris TaxID=3555 RepID=UPI0020371494|nr:MLP-like protein 31 [Beta vulgaris subsp. vulgaris]
MGVLGKMQVDIDIKTSGDKFFRLIASKPYYTSNITPQRIQCCELLEGKFGQPGSILLWIYTIADGKMRYAKTVVDIDEENKLVSLKVLEGSLLEEYKSYTLIIQALTKGTMTTAKWVAEFERFDDYGPYPKDHMDFYIGVTRDIDAYYLKD